MTVYNVDRKRLIEKITENKTAHRAIYEKAMEVYRVKVIEVFEKNLNEAKRGGTIRTYVGLIEPKDYTESYQDALDALEWDIRNVIEISQQDFARWVMNKWDWANQFTASTQAYLAE